MVSRWPELVRLAYALTGDRWLAEDLAQTALADACTAWGRVRRADDTGTANARTAYLQAHLSNGTTRRLAPAVVGGRKYFALATAKGARLTRLTLYDTHRHVLADITSIPRVK